MPSHYAIDGYESVDRTLPGYVRASAARCGDSPALVSPEGGWTYRQLLQAAAALAAALDEVTPPGGAIGVFAGRSIASYAAMLAIMDAGHVYVPLSPVLAPAQVAAILNRVELAAVIVNRDCAGAERMRALCGRIPIVDAADAIASAAGATRWSRAREDDLAYLLFTSGSEGEPKGVPVTHRNARACIDALSARLPIDGGDRVAQFADIGFDIAIAEAMLAWRAGACLYAPSQAELMAPCVYTRRHGLTVWSSVPTLAANARVLEGLPPGSLPTLRLSLFCGEPLPARLAAAWHIAAPSSLIVNLYGPTEASMVATSHHCDVEDLDDGIVPIGTPLDGIRVHIEQDDELLLSGAQVVDGYWRDATATSQMFVTAPFHGPPRRWYRTGDLVARDARGRLLFRGRRDRQAKIRGYRTELAEIERAVLRASGCGVAVAVPERGADGLYTSVIVFCDRLPAGEAIARQACRTLLAGFSVPRRIVALGTLPTTANGKLDHRILAALAGAVD